MLFFQQIHIFLSIEKSKLLFMPVHLLIQEVVGIDHHLKVLFYNDYLYNECFVSPLYIKIKSPPKKTKTNQLPFSLGKYTCTKKKTFSHRIFCLIILFDF